jgi:hypothetical protein
MNEYYGCGVIKELNKLRLSLRKVSDEELKQVLEQYRRV